jgi:hypothetical protein
LIDPQAEPKRSITFAGPVEITGDVTASKVVHNTFSMLSANPLRELTRTLEEYRAVQAEHGDGWSPPRRELPSTLPPNRQALCAGRDQEVADLARALRDRRNVEIHGPAGIGKETMLKHAAATGVLASTIIPECQGVMWPRSTCTTVADIVDEIVCACYDIQLTVPIQARTAARLLNDVRALIVLDAPNLSTEDIRTLLGLMPESVFVIASCQRSLPGSVAWSLPLGRLPWDVSRAMLERELGVPLSSEDVQRAEHLWDTSDGNPGTLMQVASYMREAAAQGTTHKVPTAEEMPLVVPRLVGWLSASARTTLDTLAVFGEVEWGPHLLTTVSSASEMRGAAKLLRTRLAVCHDGRYKLAENVKHFAARPDLVELTGRITTWVREVATPDLAAAETTVIEHALRATLDAGHHAAALALACAASPKLMMSMRWGAWGRVASLGLRAAMLTGSLRDEAYFRYVLVARKMPEGLTEHAIEMLIAAFNAGPTGDDRAEVAKARKLSADVHSTGDSSLSSAGQIAASLSPAARLAKQDAPDEGTIPPSRVVQLISRTPGANRVLGPFTRLAASHPTEFRVAVAAVVIGVSSLVAGAAASPPPVAAQMSPAPPVVNTGTETGAQPPPNAPGPSGSANQPVPPAAGTGASAEHSGSTASSADLSPRAVPTGTLAPSAVPPAQQSKRDIAYPAAPDLTGHWRLVMHRSTGDDIYTTELIQLQQRKCPTTARCYGDPGKGWWHYDHIETNNIVITPTLANDQILFTATEANSSGGTQYYDGNAPNDTTVPLRFDGDWHVDHAGAGQQQHATFTFTRTS